MRVLLVNGVYGYASTGTIVCDIKKLCEQQGIECYAAFSESNMPVSEEHNVYKIGSIWEKKLHALFCRINGKQAYYKYDEKKVLSRIVDEEFVIQFVSGAREHDPCLGGKKL